MKSVVFGGSGFLGSHVADALSAAGHEVTVFDVRESPWLRPDQRMLIGDLLDEKAVSDAVAGNDYVFTFAGIADIGESSRRPADTVRYNVLGNVNILEACVAHKPRRYVFASTLYVYSRAGGFYRCSKQASEAYIEQYSHQHGVEYTVLRYGSLYGPRSDERNGIHRFVSEAIRTGRVTYHGSPDSLREYIHVRDAAEASVEILEPRFADQHVILSGTQSIRVHDMFRMIEEIVGRPVVIDYVQDGSTGHYASTPYSYHPKVGLKYVPRVHVDLGQGLVLKIEEAHELVATNVSRERPEGQP